MPDDNEFVTYPLRLVNLTHSFRETALTAIYKYEDGTAGFISIPLSECSIHFTDESKGRVVFKRGLFMQKDLKFDHIISPG